MIVVISFVANYEAVQCGRVYVCNMNYTPSPLLLLSDNGVGFFENIFDDFHIFF